jgi:hypothetical protein
MNFTPELLTLISIGIGIFAILISLLLSMREWRKEHREDIQNMDKKIDIMETKWDANLKAMETKWETNLIHWDDKWERLITLFIEQGKKGS